MSAEEIREIFRSAEERFEKGRIERDITFYFSLGKGPGERWTVRLGPESCEVREGKHTDHADCVLKTSTGTFLKIIRDGYVPGPLDFISGRLRSNNPLLLRELQKALDL